MKKNLIPSVIFILSLTLLFWHSAAIAAPWPDDSTKLTVYVVDVGMGDAIFLDIPPKDCMLIDAGSWDDCGIDTLINFLDRFFSDPKHTAYKNTIDVAVASHQHLDHIKGFTKVLDKYRVSEYIDNGTGWTKKTGLLGQINALLKKNHIGREAITDKLIQQKGKKGVYTDTLLDPFATMGVYALAGTPKPASSNENDNSIILRVECGTVSLLLSADAEKAEEQRVLARLKQGGNLKALDADILKAGHHGSNTASTEPYLQAITPKICIVSVGVAANSQKTRDFRLPKESVVKRLVQYTTDSVNTEWSVQMFPDKKPATKNEKPNVFKSKKQDYYTSSMGTIILKTDGKEIEVETTGKGN